MKELKAQKENPNRNTITVCISANAISGAREKKSKLQASFDSADRKNYTIFVHALKSTSLSIGGEKCLTAAKELEQAGKMITSETNIRQGEEFIKAHHAEAMTLCDKLVEEGKF